jgi:hypothetical protein
MKMIPYGQGRYLVPDLVLEIVGGARVDPNVSLCSGYRVVATMFGGHDVILTSVRWPILGGAPGHGETIRPPGDDSEVRRQAQLTAEAEAADWVRKIDAAREGLTFVAPQSA